MTSEGIYEPFISIIVPVVNAEGTIKDLLDSLIRIEYNKQKIEIIIVDGGSTDKTRDIIQRYPVKMILETRRGLNIARNAGVKNSNGEIVLLTDSDCVVPMNWAKRMLENFKDPEVGCVGGNVSRYADNFLSKYADNSIMPVLRRFKKREVLGNVELFSRYPAGCNMAFRRSAIEKVNGFDEGIMYGFDEDELAERICESGYKMVLDPETVVKHQHRTSLKHLLRQTFNYGRGGALMLKKKSKSRFSRWIRVNLMLFAGWLIINASLASLAILVNPIFLLPLLAISLIPFSLLTIFYTYRALRVKEYAMPFTYPFIDTLRLFAFCLGEIYELFK